jgi:hypothetical protein
MFLARLQFGYFLGYTIFFTANGKIGLLLGAKVEDEIALPKGLAAPFVMRRINGELGTAST